MNELDNVLQDNPKQVSKANRIRESLFLSDSYEVNGEFWKWKFKPDVGAMETMIHDISFPREKINKEIIEEIFAKIKGMGLQIVKIKDWFVVATRDESLKMVWVRLEIVNNRINNMIVDETTQGKEYEEKRELCKKLYEDFIYMYEVTGGLSGINLFDRFCKDGSIEPYEVRVYRPNLRM